MGLRASDVVPISETRTRLAELAELAEDVAAGRVLDESALDQALSHATASAPASSPAHTLPRHKKA
ncbi:MAG: hypothetical protein RJA98_2069 [Pseudomonadota bacterium]